ncbi:MAG: hypothetical protein RSE93_06645 [Oscillospiraceae bacterium]
MKTTNDFISGVYLKANTINKKDFINFKKHNHNTAFAFAGMALIICMIVSLISNINYPMIQAANYEIQPFAINAKEIVANENPDVIVEAKVLKIEKSVILDGIIFTPIIIKPLKIIKGEVKNKFRIFIKGGLYNNTFVDYEAYYQRNEVAIFSLVKTNDNMYIISPEGNNIGDLIY